MKTSEMLERMQNLEETCKQIRGEICSIHSDLNTVAREMEQCLLYGSLSERNIAQSLLVLRKHSGDSCSYLGVIKRAGGLS